MSALNLRLGMLLLLLCRCSLEPQSLSPDGGVFDDVGDSGGATKDMSTTRDFSISADLSVSPKPAQRIVAQKWYVEDGSTVDGVNSFYDTKLSAPCSFYRDPAGKMRCFPRDPGFSIEYTDAACTTPIAVVHNVLCAHKPFRFALVSLTNPACALDYSQISSQVYYVGAKTSFVSTFIGDSTRCVPVLTVGLEYYPLTLAPLTDFAAAELK